MPEITRTSIKKPEPEEFPNGGYRDALTIYMTKMAALQTPDAPKPGDYKDEDEGPHTSWLGGPCDAMKLISRSGSGSSWGRGQVLLGS